MVLKVTWFMAKPCNICYESCKAQINVVNRQIEGLECTQIGAELILYIDFISNFKRFKIIHV